MSNTSTKTPLDNDRFLELVDRLNQHWDQSLVLPSSDCFAHSFPISSAVKKMMAKLRIILFADYFCSDNLKAQNWHQTIVENLSEVQLMLQEQIFGSLLCGHTRSEGLSQQLKERAHAVSLQILQQLPRVRERLNYDAEAAYHGDPACESATLPFLCYPSLLTLSYHRIAHELYQQKVPLLPRIINELAHSQTGIDIHPGATIGDYFFIDHGTGVVIGETTVIGNYVKIYHGVTLGAKSFPTDQDGKIIKGIKRHPTIGDNVTIYSNAVILGNIMIGDNSVIGGNVWLTKSVPANSTVYA